MEAVDRRYDDKGLHNVCQVIKTELHAVG
jgi:hypothetical protein